MWVYYVWLLHGTAGLFQLGVLRLAHFLVIAECWLAITVAIWGAVHSLLVWLNVEHCTRHQVH